MKLFCGLPNETASIIVAFLHIVFGTILCAAYGTAVNVVWEGRIAGEELQARPKAHQDFISSLGVRETTVTFARTFVTAFLILSATKIIQGLCLLIAINKASLLFLRIWLIFELCTFVVRISVFVLLFTLGNCKPAMIFVHSLTFAVELFCVVIVTMFIYDLSFAKVSNEIRNAKARNKFLPPPNS